MKIAVPRERKPGECRVAITPDGVATLTKLGHQLFIEKDAGLNSCFSNEEYTSAGATMVDALEQLWGEAELLVKVKEPAKEEFQYFRSDLTVFSFLHPAAAPEMTKALLESGVTGLDYDLVTEDSGRLPILEPMSIIAGKLSIQVACNALQSSSGGRGVLLSGAPGVPAGKVLVIGAGAAGSAAAEVAVGMGADVTILDINKEKLAAFSGPPLNARTVFSTPEAIEREALIADAIIGAVLIPGALAPKLLKAETLPKMKPGSVIVDICIDQGGFAESSRATSIETPLYTESGVLHYCVPNMPALVPQSSTLALTNATMPWISKLASAGIEKALETSTPLKKSLISRDGELTNKVVADALAQ